jgi:membrane associated rhomboid family serine protease
MLLPIKDDNPLRLIRFQLVTAALIAANVLIFAATGGLAGEQTLMAIAVGFGVIPVEVLNASAISPDSFHPIAEPLTLITYQFLHGSWLHLLSNMLILWILADNIEDAFGHVGFLVFYLVCGVVAGLTHVLMVPGSTVPLVGASGAIAGVMGSYLLMYPKARILVLLGMIFPLRLQAWIFLGIWIATQFLSLRAPQGAEGQAVAWWAHIGGFAAGMILTLIWPKKRSADLRS